MSNSSSYAVMAKAVLLVGVMVAVLLLSSRLYDPAHANVNGGTIVVPENSDATVVAYTAVDPEGDTVVWTVVGTDAADFSIEDGALTFNSTPDYENPVDGEPYNTYEVTVVATDDGGEETRRELTVEVKNLDEEGVVTLRPLRPKEGTNLTADVSDPDRLPGSNSTMWQWARSSSRSGNFINITEKTTLATYTPVAADVGLYLRATAYYDDGEGKYKNASVISDDTVLAMDYLNAAPVFEDGEGEPITTAIEREIPENTSAGDPVGDPITARDNDANDDPETLTYTLDGADEGKFAIDTKTGQIKVGTGTTLDFETPGSDASSNVYTVTVTATDPSTLLSDPVVTMKITVTNVEESPTIDAPTTDNLGEVTDGHTVRSYPENTPIATPVSMYTATDDEDDNDFPLKPLKWSLSGSDSSKFAIGNGDSNRGHLTFKASPDYEVPASADRDNVYEVTVTITDSAGDTDSRNVTVRVTNEDEDGEVTLLSLQPEVGIVLTTTLSDPDEGITGVTWSWHSGTLNLSCAQHTSEALWALIPNETAAAYEPVPDDENKCLRATASYTDAEGSEKSEDAISENTVQAHDTTIETPDFQDSQGDSITSTTRQVAENAKPEDLVGLPVAANDPDNDNLTYSLDSGSDAKSFDIDRATGQIKVGAGVELDFEDDRSYTVTVTAEDPSLAKDTIRVNITVTDVDEVPEVSGASTADYAEKGTGAVATYTARDPEKAGKIEWTLLGDDATLFSIERGTLKFQSPPDYENPADTGTDNTYAVTVKAIDAGGLTREKPVTITVTNVDEDGTITLLPSQPKEEVQLIATLTDPDGTVVDPSWQWARASSKTGTFTSIEGTASTCDTRLPECYKPDKDDVGKYLRVTARYNDGEGKYKRTVEILDNKVLAKDYVNRKPVFKDAEGEDITAIEREVAEDATAGARVGAPVKATDTDARGNPESLGYTLGGAGAVSFDINVNTGQISVGSGTTLDFDSNPSLRTYTVTVTATDPSGGENLLPLTVTITVTNVEESPKIMSGERTINYEEDDDVNVAEYTASDDEDKNDIPEKLLTWSLSGDDAEDFCINENGALTFNTPPDYENPTDTGRNNRYQVTVIATDSGGRTASRDVTVRVTNMEEEGTVTLSTLQPQDGIELTATVADPDGIVRNSISWEWSWALQASGQCSGIRDDAWTLIKRANAKSATYTPVKDDEGDCLRATASYTDGARRPNNPDTDVNESIDMYSGVSANPVQAADTNNEAPEFPDQDLNTDGVQNKTATRSVKENTKSTDDDPNVGRPVVAAEDKDGVDTHMPEILTYSLGGVDANSFDINPVTGQITVGVGTKLNHETKDTYTVTVTATDPSLESASITVTITVTDVDEEPELSEKSLVIGGRRGVDYLEKDRTTVATYTASGPQASGVRWSLSGDDAGDFSLSGATLNFRSTPNYENPVDRDRDNAYHVTIRARDSAGNIALLEVTVRVANVDEDGAVALSRSSASVGVELTATLTDPDGRSGDTPPITGTATNLTDDAAWRWARSSDGSTGWTNIAGAVSNAYTPVAADAGMYLRATASYTDGQGFGKSASDVSGRVTSVASDGRVSLSSSRPEVGLDLTATLSDPDGGVSGVTWQWARSPNGSTGWVDISGATSATYRPDAGDLGEYLRATAAYTDAEASDQNASAVSGVVIDVVQDGVVTLSSSQPEVEVQLTATLTDPDGGITGTAWRWAKSPDGSTGWADIAGATSMTYTPVDADVGAYLRATASYTDAQASGQTANDVSGAVVAVQEDGVVTLSSSQPEVGVELTATLTDPDGGVTGTTWQWARSSDGSTGWADIAGATSMTYKPVEADVGMYLRATAGYTDAQGSGQTAIGVSGAATERDLVSRYDANGNGQIEKDEAIRAVQDYFSDLITKAEVLTVIQLYFAS